MRHAKIKKLVSEYIDGELKNNIELVKEHIKTCEECAQLFRLHSLVRETLKENTIEVSPYLFTREGDLRYISHLDLIRLFNRIFRKANLKVAYTQGFHPWKVKVQPEFEDFQKCNKLCTQKD